MKNKKRNATENITFKENNSKQENTKQKTFNRPYSLSEFLLYIPLIDYQDLHMNVLSRVQGDVIFQDEYINTLMKRLIDNIPDSPAKQYADKAAEEVRLIEEGVNPYDVPEKFMKFNFKNDDNMSLYDAYLMELERKARKYNNQ